MPRRVAALLTVLLCASGAARAQDPLQTLPNNYSVVFENSLVEVIRAHYAAHEKIPIHDHSSLATVFVYLSDSGQVRIDHAEPGEAPVSVVRPPTVKGAFRVNNGQAERHSIENLGDTDSDFLRVELKQVPLALKETFRGRAPQSLATSGSTMEFNNPELQVERIICAGPSPCAITPSDSPSLLIPFTPAQVAEGSSKHGTTLVPGKVLWLPATKSGTILPGSSSSGHFLRILLP